MLRALFCFFAFLFSQQLFAQDRCGTVEYEKLLQQRNPSRETTDHFESWIKDKVAQKLQAYKKGERTTAGNYVIPVVVHVIHNGEIVGSGTNISDAQVLSQITVLNNDFQRLNADASNTLAEFLPVAGSFPITFVMAKQDPNGDATNGIVRVQGPQTSWSISDNYTLKGLSYWPAENYLNIWVANLSGGLLGYTQLPVSSSLQGLDDASRDRLTDGVVIDYQAYGTSQASGGGSFNLLHEYDLGRTATHEVGHFFGLRHVWGDVNNCSGTDYVDDTPTQDTDYNGKCPSGAQLDCSGDAMYSNYMNYTDDACMNIYTKGQAARMDVVINNSPRRVSLLTSLGSQAPAPVANDVQLKLVSSPDATACSGSLTPSLTIRNFGSNTITSTQINFSLNGSSVETKTFSSLNLAPNTEQVVNFTPISLSAGTTSKFSFHVLQTNGGADGRALNDTISVVTKVPVQAALPLIEPFNSKPSSWTIDNPDGLTQWQNTSIGSNGAMYLDFWNYDNTGAVDRLISPVVDLTTATTASLSFDYAYSPYTGSNDRLRVLVTTTCDFNASPVEIFNKSGTVLATAPAVSSSFTPNSSQWSSQFFSLNQFLGQRIQIAFEGLNDNGNNLYIDNVAVVNTAITAFSLAGVVSPSPVSCQSSVAPVVTVKNLGNMVIKSFTVDSYVNNLKTTQQITGAQIEVGASKDFTLASKTFSEGSNTYSVVVKSPNGLTSGPATRDSLTIQRIVNLAKDIIPLRQNFDNGIGTWITMTPDSQTGWSSESVTSDKHASLVFSSFSNTKIGEQAWLVSPILDLTNNQRASVFFETSYGYRSPQSETLQVLASTDCGETFPIQLLSLSGMELKNQSANTNWVPSSDTAWTRRPAVILDTLAGKENVRIAFVATNANGNNLYLDNIEFFTNDILNPPRTNDKNYRIYGGLEESVKITFNLNETQPVRVQVCDLMGRLLSDTIMPDTLNQTYTVVDHSIAGPGMYVVRVQMQSPAQFDSTKVLFAF